MPGAPVTNVEQCAPKLSSGIKSFFFFFMLRDSGSGIPTGYNRKGWSLFYYV